MSSRITGKLISLSGAIILRNGLTVPIGNSFYRETNSALFIDSSQFPVDSDDLCRNGLSRDVPDLDALNCALEDLRRELGYISVL